MAGIFYKISCIDPKKECNVNEPISLNADFTGTNVLTGRKFNTALESDDMKSIKTTYSSACLNSDGKEGVCCDPREFRIMPDTNMKNRYKNIKIRQNKKLGKLTSLDVCYGDGCTGDDLMEATPYLMCKIGENTLPDIQNNVIKFGDDLLNRDCPIMNCGVPKLSFGSLIKGTGKAPESKVLAHLRIRGYLRDDNVTQLKNNLDSYLMENKTSGADQILTDNDDGDSLINAAIKAKANKCVALLLSNGANLNIKSLDGRTTLHNACIYGNSTMITQLINAGADTSELDVNGHPALFYSIKYNDYNMTNYLLSLNPSMINVVDKQGNTPLHILFAYGKDVGRISKLLLNNGLNSGTKNKAGLTAYDLGLKRRRQLEHKQELNDSQKFLEAFTDTVAQAKEEEEQDGLFSEVLNKLDTGLSNLNRANVSENPHIYSGFVTAKNKLDGPINFIEEACYPYAEIEDKEECEARGAKWQQYFPDDLTAVAKVSYDEDDDDNATQVDTGDDNEDTNQTSETILNNYYNPKITPVPLKDIPGLDHDSLMKINKKTNSTPNPTQIPYETESPIFTPTPTPNTESNYINTTTIIIGVVFLLILLGIIGGVIFYNRYNS